MSDKLFECDKCDKKYGSENGLKQHIINDYPEKKNDNESIYNFQKEINIFEDMYKIYENIFYTKSIISYSGGKDSSLLVYLYLYLDINNTLINFYLYQLE